METQMKLLQLFVAFALCGCATGNSGGKVIQAISHLTINTGVPNTECGSTFPAVPGGMLTLHAWANTDAWGMDKEGNAFAGNIPPAWSICHVNVLYDKGPTEHAGAKVWLEGRQVRAQVKACGMRGSGQWVDAKFCVLVSQDEQVIRPGSGCASSTKVFQFPNGNVPACF